MRAGNWYIILRENFRTANQTNVPYYRFRAASRAPILCGRKLVPLISYWGVMYRVISVELRLVFCE